ncbi:MAG: GNAT family N-acetyltransferase [Bacillota bacterium]
MAEIRALRQEEMDGWLDHCMYVFNGGTYSKDYRQYFANHWLNDPWKDLDGILVAVEGGQILSTVRIFFRKIHISGQEISMGGIGEVSTKPECRGKGLAGEILKTALVKMEKRGIQVSVLFAGIRDYYAKFGWQERGMLWNIAEVPDDASCSMQIEQADLDADLRDIMHIYQSYSGKINGTVVRDREEYWRDWVKTEAKTLWKAINKQGQIAAYICVMEKEQQLTVREFGCLPGQDMLFEEFLAYFLKNSQQKLREVKYPSPVKSRLLPTNTERELHCMVRLVCPFRTGRGMIASTEQLLDVLNTGNNGIDNFFWWNIDNY